LGFRIIQTLLQGFWREIMIYKKSGLCIMFILCFLTTASYSQVAVPATGGNSSGTGGSASYSIGQTFYTTHSGTSGSEAQGVQQPFEISVVIGLEEAIGISLECIVYPNPTHEFIKLKVQSYKVEDLSYQIFDINGKLLENKAINTSEATIPMSNYIPATYFLKVFHGQKEIKVFKIIKN
jgi:hypothetical protein